MFVVKSNRHKWKKQLLITVSALLTLILIVQPIASAIVYRVIFSTGFETEEHLCLSAEDYEGLSVEECTFLSNYGQALRGYRYCSDATLSPLGVVVLAHGMGGGGQNRYMGLINALVMGGYLVFAYDATGNDESEGRGVQGMPQGVIDVDHALRYVKEQEEYQNLPLFLVGHSWGGHSVATVLSFHPDVSAVVSLAGFNNSEDMIRSHSVKFVGALIAFLMPYVTLYERYRFGDHAVKTAMDGFEASDAHVMVVHSREDTTVPTRYGYDLYYATYADSPRFRFILYQGRGHEGVFLSEDARKCSAALDDAYLAHKKEAGREVLSKAAFMEEYGYEAKALAEPDSNLMEEILLFFATAAEKN